MGALVATDRSAYPTTVCIYCGQELDDASRSLLATYREYASNVADRERIRIELGFDGVGV